MALAKQCDRCGAFYQQKVSPNIQIRKYTYQRDYFDIDLCPDCQKKLETWLKEKNNGN